MGIKCTWALAALCSVAWLILPRGYLLTAIGDITQCLFLVLALAASILNIKSGERRARFFWSLMGLGMAAWLCTQILWTYFEVVLHRDVPNPFVGDVILFLHMVPMMGALAMQPHREEGKTKSRMGLFDFILLGIWWLYLYIFVVIPWQYVVPNDLVYGPSFDALYFVEQFVFLICIAVAWRNSGDNWKSIYKNLFGAGAVYALSSVAAGVAIDYGKYYTGSLYDIPLLAAVAWFITTALKAKQLSNEPDSFKEIEEKKESWISNLAIGAAFSLPIFAAWAWHVSSAPHAIREFRLSLTLIAIVVIGGLRSKKQLQLDKDLDGANQELREASFTDLLTGVKNRRFLTTTIESDIRQVIRSNSSLASPNLARNRDLIFYLIDIDHFKRINDDYGHVIGDLVLVEIARRISTAIRHSDVLIRWGGEEFLVVSRYTNRDEATALPERVLAAIGSENFEVEGKTPIRTTCSIGWAAFPWYPDSPKTVAYREVLRIADCALYRSKRAGRNQAIGILPESEAPVNDPSLATTDQGRIVEDDATTKIISTFGPRTVLQTQPGSVLPASEFITSI